MSSALVQLCVDARLSHDLIRLQVRQRLQRMGLPATDVYLLNDIGGNVGVNFINTLNLLLRRGDSIAMAAVLHHDDCRAEALGLRTALDASSDEVKKLLTAQSIQCPVLTGNIRTAQNHLLWADEPEPRYQPFSFGVY